MQKATLAVIGCFFLFCGASALATAETSLFGGGAALVDPVSAEPQVLIPVPLTRQGRDYTCGVACVQSVLRYAGYAFDVREELLLGPLGATPNDGTPFRGIVDFLNQVRRPTVEGKPGERVMRAELRQNMTLADLTRSLDAGTPVICVLQAWWVDAAGREQPRHDYSGEWDSGHYVIAVGYDEDRIYFMDPSLAGDYGYIPRAELDARWHDVDVRRGASARYEHTGVVVAVDRPEYKVHEYQRIW